MLSVWSAARACGERLPLVNPMQFWRPWPWTQIDVICGEGAVYRPPALHLHETLQILQPLSPVIVTTGTRTELVEAGAIHLTAPFDPCRARGVEDHTYRARMIFVGPEVLSRAGVQSHHSGSPGLPPRSAACSALFTDLHRVPTGGDSAIRFVAALQELLSTGAEQTCASSLPDGVVRARDYLREHATESVSLETLAKEAFLSKYHLLRSFRRALGLTPHEYQMQLRLARARRLLADGSAISRATYDAGFSDQSHLTRRFIAFYGMTPARYARQVTSPLAGSPRPPMRDAAWNSVSAA
jgi:AraC-like DNA-binding protein